MKHEKNIARKKGGVNEVAEEITFRYSVHDKNFQTGITYCFTITQNHLKELKINYLLIFKKNYRVQR